MMIYFILLLTRILYTQQLPFKEINVCHQRDTNCVKLTECRSFMDLIQTEEKPLHISIQKFIRTKLCGFTEENPKVCCTKVPGELKYFKSDAQVNVCEHPSKCLTVNECQPIMQLLKSPLNSEFLLTIKQCGFNKRNPKICCPHTVAAKKLQKDQKSKSNYSLAEKVEIINAGMDDLIDVMAFDLLRRKRENLDKNLEIEIR